jgi:hypothetical protein
MPLADALDAWHQFYSLFGTASATMVGLLFVAASVGSGVFSTERRAPLRMFLSASVVNFSLLLAVCLIVMVPVRSWGMLGGLIGGCGLAGLGHCCLAWRDVVHDGMIAKIDLEDRVWYIALPIGGYLALAGAALAVGLGLAWGLAALALSMGMLLMVGLHNAWDITVWITARRQR